ncbi:MAG: TIGR02117 family protein [Saprospiraceae bacterium]|nr:TIGR02117 family protein [Saprospiraceae bacterium]
MKQRASKIFKKSVRLLAWIIGGLLLFISIYCLAAISLSRIPVNKNPEAGKEMDIYILSNGVHVDIVVPVKSDLIDWSQHMEYDHTRAVDTLADWIAFGWGDKGFYLDTPTWAELKFSVAFKAAFALGSSAIHSTFYRELEENETCKKLTISKQQYAGLIQYIKESLEWTPDNHVKLIETDARYSDHDAFYEAHRTYHLFHTCNTWANNALKAAGLKASFWTPYDKGIFYHYRDNN